MGIGTNQGERMLKLVCNEARLLLLLLLLLLNLLSVNFATRIHLDRLSVCSQSYKKKDASKTITFLALPLLSLCRFRIPAARLDEEKEGCEDDGRSASTFL